MLSCLSALTEAISLRNSSECEKKLQIMSEEANKNYKLCLRKQTQLACTESDSAPVTPSWNLILPEDDVCCRSACSRNDAGVLKS